MYLCCYFTMLFYRLNLSAKRRTIFYSKQRRKTYGSLSTGQTTEANDENWSFESFWRKEAGLYSGRKAWLQLQHLARRSSLLSLSAAPVPPDKCDHYSREDERTHGRLPFTTKTSIRTHKYWTLFINKWEHQAKWVVYFTEVDSTETLDTDTGWWDTQQVSQPRLSVTLRSTDHALSGSDSLNCQWTHFHQIQQVSFLQPQPGTNFRKWTIFRINKNRREA